MASINSEIRQVARETTLEKIAETLSRMEPSITGNIPDINRFGDVAGRFGPGSRA